MALRFGQQHPRRLKILLSIVLLDRLAPDAAAPAMIDRIFAVSGHVSTLLMAYGVAALWLHPESWWAAGVVYARAGWC